MQHPKRSVGHLTDGGGDLEGIRGGLALAEGPVDLAGLPLLEHGLEGLPRGGRAGEEHQSRCAAAEAVHGAGLGGPAAHQGEEGVLQEFAAPWQGGQATGFGHGQQILVLEEHGGGEGDFRLDPGGAGPGDPLARAQGRFGRGGAFIQAHLALQDPRPPDLRAGHAVPGHEMGQKGASDPLGTDLFPVDVALVEPHAVGHSPGPAGLPLSPGPRVRWLGHGGVQNIAKINTFFSDTTPQVPTL